MRPLTDHCPKCLLPVGEETILSRAVRILGERGLQRYTVVDGFEGDQIRLALTQGFPGFRFDFIRNHDFATTNNAWSLMLAACAGDEPVFLLDSDIVFAPEVIDRIMDDPSPNRLGLRTTGNIGIEEMKVRLDDRGFVADLGKEIPVPAAAGESVGLEVFSPLFMQGLADVLRRRMRAENRVDEYYEASFVQMIRDGHRIRPVDLGRLDCMEIDTVDDLDEARRVFGSR